MAQDNDKEKNRNASPEAFGWAFQTAAGIVLMLENIKEMERIKLEGKTEDIEIWLSGEKVYAQAKSSMTVGTPSNINQVLNKAFDSLNDDFRRSDLPVRELVYISNFSNPINSEHSNLFDSDVVYSLSDLDEKDSRRIKSLLNNDVPEEKIRIRILKFQGQGLSKFASVKREVEKFLYNAISDDRCSDDVFNYWYVKFDADAGDKPVDELSLMISKDDVIWPIISSILNVNSINDDEYYNICQDYNLDDILETYKNFIKDKTFDFVFISRVVNPFDEYVSIHGSTPNSIFDYINNNWNIFSEDFSSINDEKVREELIKIIMYRIIKNNRKLKALKRASNI